jgi:hypothetical protein
MAIPGFFADPSLAPLGRTYRSTSGGWAEAQSNRPRLADRVRDMWRRR